ncbi:hypothetical protein JW859_04240, partial [bacterium]|nr:hypothetical protein [bacterium]
MPQNLLSNPGFEEGAPGELPPGWFSGEWDPEADTVNAGTSELYTIELTADNPYAGGQAVLIRNLSLQEDFSRAALLSQSVDVSGRAGQRLVCSAKVRKEMTDENYGIAVLMLRLRNSGEEVGGFATISQLLTKPEATGWQSYQFQVDATEEMTKLEVWVVIFGNAQFWVDEISLVDLGETIPLNAGPRELSPRGLENLVALTRLLGYVRHFHASDEAAACDWDEFAVRAVDAIEPATDPADLAARLTELFAPLAPTLTVYVTAAGEPPAQDWWPEPLGPDANAVYYRHRGCSQISDMPSVYSTECISVPASTGGYANPALDPRQPFKADLGGGVSCRLPLAVFADG